ncbi:uncharacterized protein C19orf85 homolog [Hyla sarda]|uniref:uncharacterized protein C19orf85 homolog n=1 Tax=Hyla sarda TaxID=327740 RepID=UPI0024C2B9F1|nr:uncharacterized protein C19orf85 homolog [Hyla sarda]
MHHRTAQFAFNLYPRSEIGFHECGRDLFTFVTVASTHIMRTLQRPKKSRPTKRKVNHRRFLQNQIYRKYSVIEAATQQLATSIFSQEPVVGKQNPPNNLNYSTIENRSNLFKDTRKEKITQLQNVLKFSSNLSVLPDGHLDSSTFLGVAEAYLVPDTISKIAISMDTLACVSDEVDTVESLFDNITDEDIFSSPYGFLHPKTHQLHTKTRSEHEYEPALQTGLIFCDTDKANRFPESFDKAGHQIPFLHMTHDSMKNKSSDFLMSSPWSDHEIVLHDVTTPEAIYMSNNEKRSPKVPFPEKGYIQVQAGYECDQDVNTDNADFSVFQLNKGIQDTLHDKIFIGKEMELQPSHEDVDYSLFWASSPEPNTKTYTSHYFKP